VPRAYDLALSLEAKPKDDRRRVPRPMATSDLGELSGNFLVNSQDALWCQTLYKNVFLTCPRTFKSPCTY